MTAPVSVLPVPGTSPTFAGRVFSCTDFSGDCARAKSAARRAA